MMENRPQHHEPFYRVIPLLVDMSGKLLIPLDMTYSNNKRSFWLAKEDLMTSLFYKFGWLGYPQYNMLPSHLYTSLYIENLPIMETISSRPYRGEL